MNEKSAGYGCGSVLAVVEDVVKDFGCKGAEDEAEKHDGFP